MSGRARTLLLEADGTSWKAVALDTLRGVLRLKIDVNDLPARLRAVPLARKIFGPRYESLSYTTDWKEAFRGSPDLDTETCNINNLVDYRRCLRSLRDWDLIVVLHSAAGDSLEQLLRSAARLRERRGTLLVLPGNEYHLMPEKIRFLQSAGADFVGSQLPIAAARWLYAEAAETTVLAAPHALNPAIYSPAPSTGRSMDLGFIGNVYPASIGDIERTRFVEWLRDHGPSLGLACEVRVERVVRDAWARFLGSCKGVIGAESGTYFLERTDRTAKAVTAWLRKYPAATFEEIFDRFFRVYENPVSGKALSSRHFEAIGTKTCQVLLEGSYNGILLPEVHYVAVKRDLSDAAEAIRRFRDDEYRMAIVERAYELTMSAHTYAHRVAALVRAVL